ncbi:MAG: GDSL-type esterase/lipase family protein [Solirubrobacteraceae bacterium]
MGRRFLVAVLAVACLGVGASASAQTPAPGPTLQVTEAKLGQRGDDLQFGLRFNRPVPVAQLQSRSGRVICVVLSPAASSRRSVCVSRKGGRLVTTIGAVDPALNRLGPQHVLRTARTRVDGGFLQLRTPARSLKVRLGTRVTWLALTRFNDGGPCSAALAFNPAACTQRFPVAGELALKTRSSRRPLFARLGRLRLLATGDSMIQIVDGYLARKLERRRKTRVRSEAHISTGISNPKRLNWVTRARRQASGTKPDVTVMFIGANDGFNMGSAVCCNAPWVAEYARRVQSMMRSYRRGGRSLVYWLTLPAPSKPNFAKVFSPVNEAIRRAGKRFDSGVRVIDLAKVFTPGGVFRKTMVFRGRRVTVRQGDGVHLSTAGASIAATLIIERLRADRALPRLK